VLKELGLELSKEKTRITNFKEGFDFLGFNCKQQHIKMKDKAVESFRIKVKEITIRHRNLDEEVIQRLNNQIRGTVNYFAKNNTSVAPTSQHIFANSFFREDKTQFDTLPTRDFFD